MIDRLHSKAILKSNIRFARMAKAALARAWIRGARMIHALVSAALDRVQFYTGFRICFMRIAIVFALPIRERKDLA
jgi:hypothetical protein